MKVLKLAIIAMSTIAPSMLITTAASASHSYTFEGLVDVKKGIQLRCKVIVVKTPSHTVPDTGTVTVTIGPPQAECAALTVTSNPMTYTQGAADPVTGWKAMTVYGFRAETITLGNCAGDVTIRKREIPGSSPSQWEMDLTTVIPAEFGGGDCEVGGIIPQI